VGRKVSADEWKQSLVLAKLFAKLVSGADEVAKSFNWDEGLWSRVFLGLTRETLMVALKNASF
jgi:hypothetical protein